MIMSQLDEKRYWYERMYEFLQRESHPADTFKEGFHTTHFLKIWCYIHSSWEKIMGNILHSYLPLPLFIQVCNKSYKKIMKNCTCIFISIWGCWINLYNLIEHSKMWANYFTYCVDQKTTKLIHAFFVQK